MSTCPTPRLVFLSIAGAALVAGCAPTDYSGTWVGTADCDGVEIDMNADIDSTALFEAPTEYYWDGQFKDIPGSFLGGDVPFEQDVRGTGSIGDGSNGDGWSMGVLLTDCFDDSVLSGTDRCPDMIGVVISADSITGTVDGEWADSCDFEMVPL